MKPSIHEPLSLAQLGYSSTLGTTDRDTFRMSPRQTEPLTPVQQCSPEFSGVALLPEPEAQGSRSRLWPGCRPHHLVPAVIQNVVRLEL
jgi:hypothetical protein